MGAGGATYHDMIEKYCHVGIMKTSIGRYIYILPQFFREMMSKL
jgi:hypothetical protein